MCKPRACNFNEKEVSADFLQILRIFWEQPFNRTIVRSSRREVFLGKGILKICNKFTGEHPCQSAISIKLLSSFIEIAFRHGCSPIYLQHIFRTLFPKNTSEGLLRKVNNRGTKSIGFTLSFFLNLSISLFHSSSPAYSELRQTSKINLFLTL